MSFSDEMRGSIGGLLAGKILRVDLTTGAVVTEPTAP
jgi:hypothetical protein